LTTQKNKQKKKAQSMI